MLLVVTSLGRWEERGSRRVEEIEKSILGLEKED